MAGLPRIGSAAISAFFDRPVHAVAADLLGGVIAWNPPDGQVVAVRLSEVEAYGAAEDPGSHAHRGPTPRNATMFGPSGHLYCYLSYGIHRLLNLVCRPEGEAAAVLLRAGAVIAGQELARSRRGTGRTLPARALPDRDLACGPGCLGQVFAADAHTDGTPVQLCPPGLWETAPEAALTTVPEAVAGSVLGPPAELPAGWSFSPPAVPVAHLTGPRVGVSGPGGDPSAFPWRYRIPDDPTVSRFSPGRRGRRADTAEQRGMSGQ